MKGGEENEEGRNLWRKAGKEEMKRYGGIGEAKGKRERRGRKTYRAWKARKGEKLIDMINCVRK